MDKLANFASVLVIAASVIMTVCAVYMARFEYRLMEKIRKDFVPAEIFTQSMGWSRDEHERFDDQFAKLWSEIQRMRERK